MADRATHTGRRSGSQRVRARIAAAAERAERDPDDVRLIAITKGTPATLVDEAIAAGVEDVGENRVQEADDKQREVTPRGSRWHLVGHLQTNKAARAARLFDVVHSVDSRRVADALSANRPAGRDPARRAARGRAHRHRRRGFGVAEPDVEEVVAAARQRPVDPPHGADDDRAALGGSRGSRGRTSRACATSVTTWSTSPAGRFPS